jgi:hypothetical protein
VRRKPDPRPRPHCHEEAPCSGVRLTVISPGYVATPFLSAEERDRDGVLEPSDDAETITWCLRLSPAAIVRDAALEDSVTVPATPSLRHSSVRDRQVAGAPRRRRRRRGRVDRRERAGARVPDPQRGRRVQRGP